MADTGTIGSPMPAKTQCYLFRLGVYFTSKWAIIPAA
jgi:hypothetical protein